MQLTEHNVSDLVKRIEELEVENRRLRRSLQRAEVALEALTGRISSALR